MNARNRTGLRLLCRALRVDSAKRSYSSLVPHGSATATLHADADQVRFTTDGDVAPPLSLTSTFTCPDDGESGHVYARISNPTRDRAEALLGAVEGVPDAPAHAVLYSSGLSACFALLAHWRPRRVAVRGGYHGTHLVLEKLHRIAGGHAFQSVSLPHPDDVASTLDVGDVLWLETPLNPTSEVYDIAAFATAARACGALVAVDGTFAPPPLQRPLTIGADAVMHSTTKALSGHSDAVGGALCVADPELAAALRADRTALGSTPGSLEVWLLMRSLRTLHLRVERQSNTAAALAAWLNSACVNGADHPLAGLVRAVHYPGLPSHPGHEVAARQMPGGFGGCLALELATEATARALPRALRLFGDATSLGGVESLCEWRRKYDDEVSPLLVRLSVGLEDESHLREDLLRAILKCRDSAVDSAA